MKIKLKGDEWYPVYEVYEEQGGGTEVEVDAEVEVDDATVARWAVAMEAFKAAQDEMTAIVDAAEAAREAQRSRS